MLTEPAVPSDFAASVRVRARTSATVGDVGRGGLPRELAQREPVTVGREQRDLLALDLHADAGEQRERVVPARRDGDLGDGVRELVAVDGAGDLRHDRKARVVLDGHGQQRETARTAGDDDLRALEDDIDRLAGQRARDLREQPAGDQDGAGLRDVGGDLRACGDLVVEARQLDRAGGVGLDADAGEHGDRGTRGQAAGRPRDGVGQNVTIDPEPHATPLVVADLDRRGRYPQARTEVGGASPCDRAGGNDTSVPSQASAEHYARGPTPDTARAAVGLCVSSRAGAVRSRCWSLSRSTVCGSLQGRSLVVVVTAVDSVENHRSCRSPQVFGVDPGCGQTGPSGGCAWTTRRPSTAVHRRTPLCPHRAGPRPPSSTGVCTGVNIRPMHVSPRP